MKFTYSNGATPLDGFTIQRGLGVGGFGEVYFAVSTAGKKVALKKIQRNLDIELRGVRQCINLKHVNLISLWDIRTNEQDENWVVMEYVPGPSLRDIVEAHPSGLPPEEVKRWFLSTASGVAYLHQQGIVHRDLKPGNIFLDSESDIIKIGDYGLSKFISTSRKSGQTEAVGTFHYMAPEIGRGVYGKEIDIYALGIILFELLTGDVPFDGESMQEIGMKHLTDLPNVDRVPSGFQDVILNALCKDPEERYHSVPEMLAAMPWPEVALNCQKIISHQSVGPLVTGVGREREYSSSFRANPHSLTHVRDSSESLKESANEGLGDTAERGSTIVPKLPPTIINRSDILAESPDITFGPLVDNSQHSDREPGAPASRGAPSNGAPFASPPFSTPFSTPSFQSEASTLCGSGGESGDAASDSAIRFFDEAGSFAPASTPPTSSKYSEEPIARVLQTGVSNLGTWWNSNNISTPLKLFLLAIAGIVIVTNSQWLLPLALGLGLVYLIYYAVRNWLHPESENETTATPNFSSNVSSNVPQEKLTRRERKRQSKRQTLSQIRHWLGQRPASDRVTELLGSLLVAALACMVFNLLGLAVGGSILDATVESWAVYAWLTTTSIIACWILLMIGKFWENQIGENLLRRFSMLATGLAVGAVAFFGANMFGVDLANTTLFPLGASGPSRFAIKGLPMLPAYLLFFAGLFGILRWWNQADPIRTTRLSIVSVSLCLIWASVFSHLLEVPMTPNCILAVVISISIQLAAPWLPPEQRAAICGRSK